MGWRFDTVIACYILALPSLVLSVTALLGRFSNALRKGLFVYLFVTGSVALLICAIDIPYFGQFFARFSVTALEWLDSPAFVFGMIIQEPRYWLAIIPFLALIGVYFKVLQTTLIKEQERESKRKPSTAIVLALISFLLVFLGIRGRLEQKSPIRIGTAYFSNNAFLNQLGLNPNFTFIRSYIDSRQKENQLVQLMPDEEALRIVQTELGVQQEDSLAPLSRKRNVGQQGKSLNVVLVIMESMSAAKMTRHGNPDRLTPFLDSISNRGIYFDQIYTAGIHTFNGIFSTLFSYPALFRQHPMKNSEMPRYHGLSTALKQHGYNTVYFTTHDAQFDNAGGFLLANDFDEVVSKSDYPADKVKTTLGVPDDYLFEFAIPRLTSLHHKNKPFFAAFMTASDHGPFYIPEYFQPRNKDIKKQIVEYADFSLGKFIALASKQEWFNNTLFVFIADHGAPLDPTYEMSLSYNHSPLLFYSPAHIPNPDLITKIGGQIDVYPTIMGFLGWPYVNQTPGIDLLHEKRPAIFCGADDKFAVLDSAWFLMVRNDKSVALYKYKEKNTQNFATDFPDVVKRLRMYGEANLQTTQYLLRQHKQ